MRSVARKPRVWKRKVSQRREAVRTINYSNHIKPLGKFLRSCSTD